MELVSLSPSIVCALLLVVGGLASFINVMAGGGSVISLGTMILLGIDPQVANGTNRVALVAESIAAITVYRKKLQNDIQESLVLSLWTLPGAIIGAFFAVEIPPEWFQRILVLVIVFVLFTIVFPFKLPDEDSAKASNPLFYVCLVLIGFYGGFIQAGIGFVIMVCFRQIAGMNLIQINIHKVYIVLLYTLPVLAVFIVTDNIHWLYALALSIGHFIGAWFSADLSIKRGEALIKWVVVIAMSIMAIKLAMDSF